MRTWLLVLTFVLIEVVGVVGPAGAITVNGVEYVLLAKHSITMENGTISPSGISGNVGVSDTDGILQIGSHNIIKGTATAHHIMFGSFSLTKTCRFDVSSLASPGSVCGSVVKPLPAGTLPLVASWPPGPLGAVPVDTCVKIAVDTIVPANGTVALSPGCYRDVRVNAGGTLHLSGGSYTFKSLRLLNGSTLEGGSATVNVQGATITEPNVTINGVTIETPAASGEAISIGNNTSLANVVLYAPNARIHLHTGWGGANFEAVAGTIVVQPPDGTTMCECPPGFVFSDAPGKPRECVPVVK